MRIQLVKNAPDDGPVRSETCRANTRDIVGLHIYYKMIHGFYNIKLIFYEFLLPPQPPFLASILPPVVAFMNVKVTQMKRVPPFLEER